MKMTLSQKSQKIEELISLFTVGIDTWKKAGEILVELVEADSGVYEEIISKCPMITPNALANFERMGRGLLYPPLAMDGSPGGKKLQALPLSQQVKYESEPIPLIVHTENGTDVLMVRAKDMTRDQAAQVFGKGRIRTEGEQKALLIEMRSKATPSRPSENIAAWKIRNGRVEFVTGATLSAGELATIITQLTK